MKKVGIITFHTALNYGAVLQAYALERFLSQLQVENEILDYHCPFIDKCYHPFFISDGKIINSIARGLIFGRVIKRKRKAFDQFIAAELNISKPYIDPKSIQKDRENYSFFISGSDQVWSPVSAGFDEAYFLPFAKDEQKISYAASIGTNSISNEKLIEYQKRLSGFSVLSVREESAKELLQRLDQHRKIYVHVDPTLLLDKNSWAQLLIPMPLDIPDNYLLIFNVEKPIFDVKFAKQRARAKGLNIVYVNDRTLKKDHDIFYIEAPAPDLLLTLFANAEAVVTNSFHGTVFSIIFQKEFYVELDNRRQRNIRAEDLLKGLGIEKREICDASSNPDEIIDWDRVESILQEKRADASEYFNIIFKDGLV